MNKSTVQNAVSFQMVDNLSLFLRYRRFFPIKTGRNQRVKTHDELIHLIRAAISKHDGNLGIMLSGGMDSAVISGCIQRPYTAYTFDYGTGLEEYSEFSNASKYLLSGAKHKRVHISKKAFLAAAEELTELLQMPLVPHAPALYIAAKQAKEDGIDVMLTGIGADGRFGGFTHLWRHNQKDDFLVQMDKQFVNPKLVLQSPGETDWVIEHFVKNGVVDVGKFLLQIGTEGTASSEALGAANLQVEEPFRDLEWDRIENTGPANGKSIIRKACEALFPETGALPKKALPIPYKEWFKDYTPSRSDFLPNAVRHIHGKRRCLVFGVDLYLTLQERHGWTLPPVNSLFED